MSEDQSPYRVSPEGQAVTRKLDLDGLVNKGLADPDFARAYVEGLHEEVRAVCEESAALREENAKLEKRVEELEAELAREKKLHLQANAMRIQQMERDDAVFVSLRSQRDRLREAIEPFIVWMRAMENHPQVVSTGSTFDDDDVPFMTTIEWGDLRAARAAYEETGEKQ